MSATLLALTLPWMLALALVPEHGRATPLSRAALTAVLGTAALGGPFPVALAAALAHLLVFALPQTRLATYSAALVAHSAISVVAALVYPDAFASGAWAAEASTLYPLGLFAAGLIAATVLGGPAVGHLMAQWRADAGIEGLDNAGRMIGLMERALIYLMVMVGEPTGIGFLIAAKSILRFETASRNQKASEYVIIGTLASFGWALAVAFGTDVMLDQLPPLEIGRADP